MKQFQWTAVLFFAAVFCFLVVIPVNAAQIQNSEPEAICIPVDKETGTIYAKDAEQNTLGISDFWIDDGKIYLLSNVYNRIYVYENNIRIDEIDLDRFGTTAIFFAIDGNRAWIYNNTGKLVFLENWEEKGAISVSSFADSEAIEGLEVRDGDLYVTISSFAVRDSITYRISFSEGQLICTENIPGRLIHEGDIENSAEVRTLLSSVTEKQARKDGYLFTAQQGVMDLGIGKDGNRYILSREILDDGETEYYLQRVYCFNGTGRLKEVFNLPNMLPTCLDAIRMVGGEVYILDTEKDVIILDTLGNLPEHSLKDCLLPFDWSGRKNKVTQEKETDHSDPPVRTSPSYVTRFSCISRIDSYCTPFTWSCSAATSSYRLPLFNTRGIKTNEKDTCFIVVGNPDIHFIRMYRASV